MPVNFNRAYDVGAVLLGCACDTLRTTEHGCPPRICLVPGDEPSVENCCAGQGQLTVNVGRIYESRSFPTEDIGTPSNCDIPLEVVAYNIEIWRCMPVGSHNKPPSCDKLDDAARMTMSDMMAVRWGIKCCLMGDRLLDLIGPHRWMFESQISKEPSGGCAGSSLSVLIGMNQCWEC